ncbi:LysR family transcriptional regulator [Gordonia jinghuaiqii]|uniref:LysR family transcriptional regulator n=1 Tax=Gordonia jinghuaiqii TaxID=2758710 RepID=A0A7D7QV95_9ACTN|nr:LysR family transcriptional regulator [Gordonia jinghuaiqii]QMT00429.1 LysR family transcriptional regulator [Gordonia jinghuaiqii]
MNSSAPSSERQHQPKVTTIERSATNNGCAHTNSNSGGLAVETSAIHYVPLLETLSVLGQSQSISQAADRLNMTQQAVSARIKRLERSVGQQLVSRTRFGSVLTPAGVTLAGMAEELLGVVERIDTTMGSLRGGDHAVVRVAASLTVTEYLFPRWLVQLRELFGDAAAVTAANSSTVFELVRSGGHNLGFVETPDLPGDLRSRKVSRDELVLVVAPSHPWASGHRTGADAEGVSLARLAATPLVTREIGSGTRLSYERMVQSRLPGTAIAPPALELPTNAAVKTAVIGGTGPAVLSVLIVRDDIESGRMQVIPIKNTRLIRNITAVWSPRNNALTEPARHLLEVAERRGFRR